MTMLAKILLSALMFSMAGLANASGFIIDSAHSAISYNAVQTSAVKAETLKNISGAISKQGDVNVIVGLQDYDASQALLKTKIDLAKLWQMPTMQRLKVPATLQMSGSSKVVNLELLAAKVAGGQLLVVSIEPVIVDVANEQLSVNFVVSFNPVS
ncbi:hypothetical protein J3998_10155 [Thiomicrorhabdus sp. 6S2-11]|uniref:YceI family protein n=1 Tax=Thiomicrorhabdus marina TaxID=2818442 RepID=A0ABS3Q787_9GAMM|nr:hypothetical protein [Thiomicrorhabdus marina]MBO1927938.1 hypothetical protein [Thiomicrorhabdus marina]